MTSPNAQFQNCLTDPGPLSGDAAVHAISLHFNCVGGCLIQQRATAALDAEYVALPPTADSSAEDARFAEQLREAARLTANHDQH